AVDRPRVYRSGAERRGPRVAAERRDEDGNAREAAHPLGEQQRRGRRGVVEQRGAQHRRVRLARDQVPERERGVERRLSDHVQGQSLDLWYRPVSAELKNLAARGRATARETSRLQMDVTREAVDRAEVEEVS